MNDDDDDGELPTSVAANLAGKIAMEMKGHRGTSSSPVLGEREGERVYCIADTRASLEPMI